jgi:hypothetical protein
MRKFIKLSHEVKIELDWVFAKPRTLLIGVFLSAVLSFGFFCLSLAIGTYSELTLPFAAAIIILWTFSDVTLTNQLMFDKNRSLEAVNSNADFRHILFIKNVAVVILSIPLCLVFGFILAIIVGRWSELLYGLVMSLALLWGWLGVGNVLSVLLPFEPKEIKELLVHKKHWLRYGFYYGFPWIILPGYTTMLAIPLVLMHWFTGNALFAHKVLSFITLLTISIIIWQIGLSIAYRFTKNPKSKIQSLLSKPGKI